MNQESENLNQSTEFDKLLSESFNNSNLKEGQIVKGKIVEINDEFVLCDVGLKTEGKIRRSEFEYLKDPKDLEINKTISIFLERVENHNGECVLSYSKAMSKSIWSEIEKAFKAGELITGQIEKRVKGGLSVNCGIECFLPGSLVSSRPMKDISSLLNTPMKFKVVKMDEKRSNVVVSRRAVLEENEKESRAQRFAQLKLGDVVEGEVKALTDYGAFIELEGHFDALLHNSDIGYQRISHASEVLKLHQKISCKVIKLDETKNRVSLGLKQMQASPWDTVKDKYKVGDVVKGQISNVQDYGVFVEVEPGVEGLVHRQELFWDDKLNAKPGNSFSRTQSVSVVILDIDMERSRLSLSIKRLSPNPIEKFNETNSLGSIIDTKILSIKDNVIYCDINSDIEGELLKKDLSWDSDPNEEIKKYKPGDSLKVKIIENTNKIGLSVREVTGNPFDVIKDKKLDDAVTVQVISTSDNGVEVSILENGPKVFIKKSELALRKADARPNLFGKGDKFDAAITMLDLANYKISLSIRALEEKQEAEAMKAYGSPSSGLSLGSILEKTLKRDKKED